jgi:N-acetylneuraminate lyase
MTDIRGMFFPLPTVFTDDGAVDEALTRDLVDFYIESGVNALFIAGSYGQGPTLSESDRAHLAKFTIEQVNKRVPAIVHVGAASAQVAIDLGEAALADGADGVGLVGPYYYSDRKPDDIRAHFREVGRNLKCPILVYNNTKYQGYPMNPQLIGQLREDTPHIFGIKLNMGTLDEVIEVRDAVDGDLAIFAMASNLFPGMLVGQAGAVSPPLGLCPEIGVKLIAAIDANDRDEAVRLQTEVIEYHATYGAMGKLYGRAVTAVGLRHRGFPVQRYPRWDVPEISEEGQARIRAMVDRALTAAQAQPLKVASA